jgi:hypothetical protein
MTPSRLFACFLLAGLPLAAASAAVPSFTVTLSSARVDRAAQVLAFRLPEGSPAAPALRDAAGALLPLQVDDAGVAHLVVPWQPAGTALTFTLVAAPAAPAAAVRVTTVEGDLQLSVDGRPVLGYRLDREKLPRPDIKPEFKRAGYLHPVSTPSGTVVSDDYPPQHVHHHGIWSPWTKTEFQGRKPDFWNMGAKTGTVEFVALDRTWDGPVHGGLVARHRMVDLSAPQPVTALHETWEVKVLRGATATPATVFELTLTQTCATADPLILPQYHYGGLGYRGPGEWLGEANARYLTSNGETDRVKAHASRAAWISQYGMTGGRLAGLAIFGHPSNFRAPQPLRVHPKEPFVCFAPSQLGDWRIEPGAPYVARYRFVATDGAPDRAFLEACWNGYAQPATVSVKP